MPRNIIVIQLAHTKSKHTLEVDKNYTIYDLCRSIREAIPESRVGNRACIYY